MSAINNIKYFWKDLPNWAKGVVVVGGLAVTYIIGNTIYKGIQSKKQKEKDLADVKQAKRELDELSAKGIVPTMTETDFNQITGAILKQFSGCDPSFNAFGILHDPTNLKKAKVKSYYSKSGQLIYNFVDTIKNDADFLGMVGIFGTQTYQDCFEGLGVPPTTTNFVGAVNKELDQKEIVALNTLLAAKGITKRFF